MNTTFICTDILNNLMAIIMLIIIFSTITEDGIQLLVVCSIGTILCVFTGCAAILVRWAWQDPHAYPGQRLV